MLLGVMSQTLWAGYLQESAAVQVQRKRLSSGGFGIAARRQLGNFQCPGRYPANRSSTTTNENSATQPPQMTPTECPTPQEELSNAWVKWRPRGVVRRRSIIRSLMNPKKVWHIPYQRKYEVMTFVYMYTYTYQ